MKSDSKTPAPSSALSAPGLLLAANLAEQHGKDYVSNAPPRIALNFLAAELRRLAGAESGVPLEETKK